MNVYVIRHGQSTANLRDVISCDPNSRVSLTPEGKLQVAKVALQLKNIPFDAMFTSQFLRTKQTARIINSHHKVPIYEEPLLNEINLAMNGRQVSYYRKMQRESSLPKTRFKVFGGESFIDVKKRVEGFLFDLREEHNYQVVLLAVHEIVMQSVFAILHGKTDEDVLSTHIGNAVWELFNV